MRKVFLNKWNNPQIDNSSLKIYVYVVTVTSNIGIFHPWDWLENFSRSAKTFHIEIFSFCLPIFFIIIHMREICLLFFYNVFRKQCYLLTHDGNNTCNEGLKIMNGFFLFVFFFHSSRSHNHCKKRFLRGPSTTFWGHIVPKDLRLG